VTSRDVTPCRPGISIHNEFSYQGWFGGRKTMSARQIALKSKMASKKKKEQGQEINKSCAQQKNQEKKRKTDKNLVPLCSV
jgi:hypothetical protein